jgi:hypothetical protein
MRRTPIAVAILALIAGCAPEHHIVDPDPAVIPEPGSTASQMISAAEGGTIELDDFVIDFPPGAVDADTMVTVTVSDEPVPGTFTGYSPIFEFGPAGLTFDEPVSVRMPFDGPGGLATVFWTVAGGAAYVPLRTSVDGDVAIAEATHFSSAFVGTACAGEDCCDRANGDLDVLLMVDNSNSMTEEQASLAAEIPRLVRVLATGDIDQDGIQDFPALHSLRIGTVSSDMGAGGFNVPTCDGGDYGNEFGDDGVLRTSGNTSISGCSASYPSFVELSSGDPVVVEQFVNDASCVAAMGTGGCGFEQQLEAVLKAVTPSSSPLRFHQGSLGNADTENAGFARTDSILATILLTDETDCSVADPELFNVSGGPYASVDINTRCFAFPEAQHPTSRYVDGLHALRANPDDVIFAAIAGIPVDIVADPSNIDYDLILNDERMQERLDPAMPSRLIPSCNVPGRGVAFPPRRIVEVARDLGPTSVVQSICQESFTPVVDAILQLVARRATGACSP